MHCLWFAIMLNLEKPRANNAHLLSDSFCISDALLLCEVKLILLLSRAHSMALHNPVFTMDGNLLFQLPPQPCCDTMTAQFVIVVSPVPPSNKRLTARTRAL